MKIHVIEDETLLPPPLAGGSFDSWWESRQIFIHELSKHFQVESDDEILSFCEVWVSPESNTWRQFSVAVNTATKAYSRELIDTIQSSLRLLQDHYNSAIMQLDPYPISIDEEMPELFWLLVDIEEIWCMPFRSDCLVKFELTD